MALAIAISGAIAFVVLSLALFAGSDSGEESTTYVNHQFGYQVTYPEAWAAEIRDPQPADDFEHQYIRLSHGNDEVTATVNFQGGWCETGISSREEITLSGVDGIEWLCTSQSGDLEVIVRYFEDAKGRMNYTVYGHVGTDPDAVTGIVRSFDFLE